MLSVKIKMGNITEEVGCSDFDDAVNKFLKAIDSAQADAKYMKSSTIVQIVHDRQVMQEQVVPGQAGSAL